MALPVSVLAKLRALLTRAPAAVAPVAKIPEQKMLQGMYRGYSGDNPNLGRLGDEAQIYYVSPQKRIADAYAEYYANRFGADPHVEMMLVDPFKSEGYPLNLPFKREYSTKAQEIKPEDIKGRTQLYAAGGLAQYKECSCGR